MYYRIVFSVKDICTTAFGDSLKCCLRRQLTGTKLLTERVMRLREKKIKEDDEGFADDIITLKSVRRCRMEIMKLVEAGETSSLSVISCERPE